MRLGLRKNLGDADRKIKKALERALYAEALTRIEEADNELWASAIQSFEILNQLTLFLILCEHCRPINLTGMIMNSFYHEERGQNSLCAEMCETQEKSEMEGELIIALQKEALVLDEEITTVGCDRQHQEARTEAKIGGTRFLPSSQNQR